MNKSSAVTNSRIAYNIRINDPKLPVINVGNRENPTYLPVQVCHVIPGQPSNSKLDSTQTQQMIRFAVKRPAENATFIVSRGLQTAGLSDKTNPLLVSRSQELFLTSLNSLCDLMANASQSQFGINVSPDLITVTGRVLFGPKVGYGQNQQVSTFGGSWNLVPRNAPSLKFSTCSSVQRWSCLYIHMPNDYPYAQQFTSEALGNIVQNFHRVLQDTGITASAPLNLNDCS